jgi:Flp pilus assembly secretin CpaC
MTRIIAVSLGTIVSIGFVTIATASEPNTMQVITSSATSQFASLGVGKSLVIDLREDVKEVLVGNPKTVLATIRSKRRVYLTGGAVGQTDIYFFGSNGQQVGGLEIDVSTATTLSPPLLMNSAMPAKEIDMYRGSQDVVPVYCNATKCTTPPPLAETPSAGSVVNTESTTKGRDGTIIQRDTTSTSTTSR